MQTSKAVCVFLACCFLCGCGAANVSSMRASEAIYEVYVEDDKPYYSGAQPMHHTVRSNH